MGKHPIFTEKMQNGADNPMINGDKSLQKR